MSARKTAVAPRTAVVDVLSGGPVEDHDGRATHVLVDRLVECGVDADAKNVVNLLRRMEGDGLVERKVEGKRTYRIALKGWTEVRPEPEADDDEPAIGSDGPVDYARLAVALLDRVGEVMVGGNARLYEDVVGRLGVATEMVGRLEREKVEVESELRVVKLERDGLKKRLRVLEGNVEALLRAERVDEVSEKARRAVERAMTGRDRGK
jgi:hypothetical protein